GLSLLIAASTAEMIIQRANTGVLGSNVLLRIDDVELKGFAQARPIYALVPAHDPGLPEFEAARNALDRGTVQAGLAPLPAASSGKPRQTAKSASPPCHARHPLDLCA